MSNIYNLEPPTTGKVRAALIPTRCRTVHTSCSSTMRAVTSTSTVQVILKTTLGDIDVELWPKEAPKARAASCLLPLTMSVAATHAAGLATLSLLC